MSNPNMPTPPQSHIDMDNAFDDFKMTSQAERIVELIEINELNKVSGFSLGDLRDTFKRYEFDLSQSGLRVSSANKTAGLIGKVSQTAYESATTQPDGSYKEASEKTDADLAYEQRVDTEFQSIIEATYNDPQANPLRRELGGYLDIEQASESLSRGGQVQGRYFSSDISNRNQSIIMNAVGGLSPMVQQLAVQAVKQAANDARSHTRLAGMKTNSVDYINSVIEYQVSAFDDFEKATTKPIAATRHVDRLSASMYDAKGNQMFLEGRDNPDLASNQPVKQITAEFDDPFSISMRDGLNSNMQKLHSLSQQPHTQKGDYHIKNIAKDLLLNMDTLQDLMIDKLDNKYASNESDIELHNGYEQSRSLVDQVGSLAKEMPKRDYELEGMADRANRKIDEHRMAFTNRYIEATQSMANENTAAAPAPDPTPQAPSPMR